MTGMDGPAGPGLNEISGYYKRLEKLGVPMDVPKNFKLCNAGDLPDCCYLIKEGRVISYEYTNTGRQNVYSSTGNNELDSLILLPSVILGQRLFLGFMTAAPSKLIRIARDDLISTISSDAGISIAVIYILASKFVEVHKRYRAESKRGVPWKLCNLLLSLADLHGTPYDGKTLIKLKYSQQMMADYLHINRTTVARTIRELTDSGMIERINDYYCIRSIDRLRRHMDDIDNYASE